jgi:hypothetical protein
LLSCPHEQAGSGSGGDFPWGDCTEPQLAVPLFRCAAATAKAVWFPGLNREEQERTVIVSAGQTSVADVTKGNS